LGNNNLGQIVGVSSLGGFLLDGDTLIPLEVPGSSHTLPWISTITDKLLGVLAVLMVDITVLSPRILPTKPHPRPSRTRHHASPRDWFDRGLGCKKEAEKVTHTATTDFIEDSLVRLEGG